MKSLLFTLTLFAATLGFACQPSAGDRTLYDCGRLVIHDWHIHRSTHTFDGHDMDNAVLKVDMLEPRKRIGLGLVLINGRLIPLTRFLTGTQTTLEKPIRLKASNCLRVFLLGLPGAAIRIGVLRPSAPAPLPPPDITFRAVPETIQTGASSTLSWVVKDADTCTITPGIGTVNPTGSMPVSPVFDTVYTMVAAGPGGLSTSMATVWVKTSLPQIAINAPADGSRVTQSAISVSGTVQPADASVTVNGIDAMVDNGRFLASPVPLDVGGNLILATAATVDHTAEDRVTISRAALDLQPISLDIIANTSDPIDLKTSGTARINILNTGAMDIDTSYSVIVFEDLSLDGVYDPDTDNRLGRAIMDGLHPVGASLALDVAYAGELSFRDSRIMALVDADHALAETNEDNNTIAHAFSGIDLSASRLVAHTGDCPVSANLQVRLGNAGSFDVGPNIPVSLYRHDKDGQRQLIATAHSILPLSPGQFEDIRLQWSQPSADTVQVIAVANDDGRSQAASIADGRTGNNRIELPWTGCREHIVGPGSISGRVIDAVDGSLVADAIVSLYATGSDDTPLTQTRTDVAGAFIFTGLSSGDYQLVASGLSFDGDVRSVHLIEHATRQDLFVSPALSTDEVRIILSWGAAPSDLEAHMTGPNPQGCRHHCFYWNRQIPGARLDTDATGGFGPETITLSGQPAGVYRYYVHNFSDRLSPDSNGLAESEARVRVLFGDGRQPMAFYPPSRSGTVWHVFDVDAATGQLTPVNRMGYQDEPGKIDFPMIRSIPPVQADVDTPYTYTVRAVDADTDDLLFRLLEAPEGMSIDPLSGRIEWTPHAGQMGSHTVAVSVKEDDCGEDVQRFRVHVALLSAPRVWFSVSPCNGFNPDGDITLAWKVENADWIEIDNGIGTVAANGRLELPSPSSRIAYTLTAGNAAGTATEVAMETTPAEAAFRICDNGSIDQYQLSWNLPCATECDISPGIGPVPCSGSTFVSRNTAHAFTLTGANPVGMHWNLKRQAGLCGGDAPDAGVKTTCSWNPGDPVQIYWHAPWAVSIRIEPDVGPVANTGNFTVMPMQPTAYTVVATDTYGQDFSQSVEVPQFRNARVRVAGADPPAVSPGQPTELYWAASCVDYCRIESTAGPAIGPVENAGRVMVTPELLPATYTIIAVKSDVDVDSKTITIDLGAPAVTFSASPGLIKPGEAVTLSWQTREASACRIESDHGPHIGAVDVAGSIEVRPEANTTYVLHADGPGGSSRARASVTYVKPAVHIQADPKAILPGGSSVLTWVFSNADRCEIDQGIGPVDLGGSVVVSPVKRTAYTITATGPGGSAAAQTVVGCIEPELHIDVSPASVHAGESVVLTWSSTGSQDCLLSNGIGLVPPSGSIEVVPTRDTTYMLSAIGCDGPVQATASVAMACHPEIEVTQPDGIGDRVNTAYRIRWTDADCDDDATISIYYDNDTTGADGTLIVDGLHEDPDFSMDGFSWNTAAMPEGEYFIYLTIDDERHDPVVAYSSGRITVDHSLPPLTEIRLEPDNVRPDYFEDDIDIDGNAAIVGYRGYGACVYARNQGVWQLDQFLGCPDEEFRSRFGSSVGISGDWAVVGVMDDWPQWGHEPGVAYMFHREPNGWFFHSRLAPSQADIGLYGSTVAIDQDVVVVTTRGTEAYMGFEAPGRVFVFRLESGIWTEQQVLMPTDSGSYDYFGHSAAVDQEVIVVGADRAQEGGSGVGSAYVFRHRNGQWIQEASFSDGLSRSGFGRSVSVSGNTAIVGAPLTMNTHYAAGMAHVYQKGPATDDPWQLSATLALADPASYDYFGASVAADDRFAVVGAMGRDVAGTGSGVAYIFRQEGDSWVQRIGVSAGDAAVNHRFGAKVAMDNGSLLAISDNAVHMFTTCGASLAADPSFIAPGDAVTLRWDTRLAEDVTISPAPGAVPPRGDASHSPTDTTTYTLHAAGLYGETSQSATVRVGTWKPVVSIDADHESILAGESIVLSWNTQYANTVFIDPGIGVVDPNGSMVLSPTATTTYTVTAQGPGGTTTTAVTVAVSILQPTAQLELTANTVDLGQPITLTWTTQYASAVSIAPHIGSVAAHGSMEVIPADTTTYVLSAVGPGGTAESQATVEVAWPPPMVNLSVDLSIVDSGDPVILSWVTQHAHSCTIEPDIGTVDPNGSLQLTPVQTTTYTLTSTGPGGTSTDSVTVTVNNLSPIQIEILSPIDGDFINRPDVMVHGTFDNANGVETGITVNGKVAMVYGSQFAVNHIPLVEGENTITVTATDVDGNVLTESISLKASRPEHYIQMHSNIESSTPPLETNLYINGTFSIEGASVAYIGAGAVEFLESGDDRFRIRLIGDGIYYLTAEAEFESNVYTDTIAVVVLNAADIDALLQKKWADMKAALIDNDIEKALQYHLAQSRDSYSAIYNAIGNDLPTLISQMQGISLVYCVDGTAKYRILQNHNINGQTVTITYYVYFIHDEDGLLWIEEY